MIVAVVVAVAENGVIGRGGQLPWHLSADLRRFKALTMGHVLIMGRRTYESIGRPLPGRETIVLSRNADYRPDGVQVAADLDAALKLVPPERNAFVVGGAEVYRAALERADRLHLTRVHAEVEGETFFPQWDPSQWRLVASERHDADERHLLAFSFEDWQRGESGLDQASGE